MKLYQKQKKNIFEKLCLNIGKGLVFEMELQGLFPQTLHLHLMTQLIPLNPDASSCSYFARTVIHL